MGRSQSASSFSEAFGFHHALQLEIDTALRSGSSVWPESLCASLLMRFPKVGMSEAEALAEILQATTAAHVPTRRVAIYPPCHPPETRRVPDVQAFGGCRRRDAAVHPWNGVFAAP